MKMKKTEPGEARVQDFRSTTATCFNWSVLIYLSILMFYLSVTVAVK